MEEVTPFYRKRGVVAVAATLGGVLILAGFWGWFRSRQFLYTDDAVVDGQKISVGSQCAGRVVDLSAREGQAVQKGTVLAELDASEADAQGAEAEAALRSSEADQTLSASGLAKADADWRRDVTLFKSGAISQAEFEEARKALSDMKVRKRVADLEVQSAKARLEIARTQARYRSLIAPEDGVVAKRWVGAGDVVQAGQTLYTLYDLSRVTILANIEESSVGRVRAGAKARVTVDAYPGREFVGTVDALLPCTASQLEPTPPSNATGDFTKLTQYVPVRLSLDGVPERANGGPSPLRPGMSVEVRIQED
jgi:membrane fusion protein (multidrug efflux system)